MTKQIDIVEKAMTKIYKTGEEISTWILENNVEELKKHHLEWALEEVDNEED